jgi:ABC-2 type transport system ATP-binding protein
LTKRAFGRLAGWVVVTALAIVVAPSVEPVDPTLHGLANGVVFGCLVGGAIFAVLARRRLPAAAVAALPRRRLIARSVVLTAKSAQEEALWRAVLLGLLVGPLGRLAAVGAATVLFAAAHAQRQGRAAAAHLVTGTAFGVVYVVTGRLLAAVAAHATYNVLVGAGSMTKEDMSVSDTGRRANGVVASAALERRPMIDHQPAAARARLEGVVKSFGDVRALNGLDLALHRGEVLALLGPNGAGKSTAVALMLGLRTPDVGRAVLDGGDPRDPSSRCAVGAVLQDVGFPPTLRVREVVELVGAHYPARRSVADVLDPLGLTSLAEKQAAGLSGGQKRRLAVAVALAGNPEILFLDEPTAGMDAAARRALLKDVADFARRGAAVLLTTQQLAEAEEIATRVVLLDHGRVVLEGTVPEMRARGGMTKVSLRAETLPPLTGVTSIDSRGDRHVILVEDSDALIRELVGGGVPFQELEVVPVSLEDAFIAITTESTE